MLDSDAPAWVILKAHHDRTTGCWEWQGSRTRRYGGNGGDRAVVSAGPSSGRTVARVMWEETHDKLPATQVIRHACDNPMCVRPEHLTPGTHYQNTTDARMRGRLKPGGREHKPRANAT